MNDKWLGGPPSVIIPRLQSLLADIQSLASPGGFDGPTDAVIIRNCILAQRSVPCLIGQMKGHPQIKDGPGITSELFYLDRKRKLARTLSRWYRFDQGLLDI
ncbi:hypothetical protein DXT98_05975 [Agrobacterium sp. ICMP 7243]|uniref:hypothetical protein n=1 Tax=Rhizobium rhizogenes TaxID=359 RepID=UPI000645652E|nr:hypothetical protein [Rhizobium rhizogenes]KAA6489925.1 hypothetical protein DXT98_05975 [Agrobacterium sp. ICMP 7243]NTF48828.1 hypothetical protein [Rhizobium rhizogenes]NTH06213.1 hypothetical protein [Rhizobium rhizogenes]